MSWGHPAHAPKTPRPVAQVRRVGAPPPRRAVPAICRAHESVSSHAPIGRPREGSRPFPEQVHGQAALVRSSARLTPTPSPPMPRCVVPSFASGPPSSSRSSRSLTPSIRRRATALPVMFRERPAQSGGLRRFPRSIWKEPFMLRKSMIVLFALGAAFCAAALTSSPKPSAAAGCCGCCDNCSCGCSSGDACTCGCCGEGCCGGSASC